MELQEQVTALTAENEQYKSIVKNIDSEKLALDQMLVSALKECVSAKKDVILKDCALSEINQQLQALMGVRITLENEISRLQDLNTHLSEANAQQLETINTLQSHGQSGG